VASEPAVDVVVSLAPEDFQQVVRIALTKPRANVADVIREILLAGLADWDRALRDSA
jgi:hypothetical protein